MSGSTPIAGAILAGGQSRRMGHDKARLMLDGASLLDQAISRLRPQVGQLVINVHAAADDPGSEDIAIVTDAPGDHQGPLAGILACLTWAETHGFDRVVTVAVDTPFFPRDLVARLAAAAEDRALACATSGGRLHPVFGLWPVMLADELAKEIDGGRRSVHDFMLRHQAGTADWPAEPHDPFFNINTPADLDKALRLKREFRP